MEPMKPATDTRRILGLLAAVLLVLGALVTPRAAALIPGIYAPLSGEARSRVAIKRPLVFAVIGDYRTGGDAAGRVARMVGSWNPSFIVTTGDDYYASAGGTGGQRYDNSTAKYYSHWMADVSTGRGGASRNAFFPSLGNHDYTDATPGPATYLGYFNLPGKWLKSSSGNERFYDFVYGNVHFFALNSHSSEPSGTLATSAQAQWLRTRLAASKSRWNIVFDHAPPFSSDDTHGSDSRMQWPYAAWGTDAVLSGHAHTYERVSRDGIPYLVNGLGGAGRYGFRTPYVAGSQRRYNANWGALKVTVTAHTMTFEFYSVGGGAPVDRHVVVAP
jgi:hypothetical protein